MQNKSTKVYLSFGRHGRYGSDTAIERMSMLDAFYSGRQLAETLPPCVTIFYSPVPRAVQTMQFRRLGLGCCRAVVRPELEESAPTFTIRRWRDSIVQNAEAGERHFHFVTHLPVLEKLGLPDLDAGSICICEADNWQEMLAENYEVRLWPKTSPEELQKLLQKMKITPETLERLNPDDIYRILGGLS